DFEYAKFTKPSDWDKWLEAFKKKAEHAGIYDFVNPNHRQRRPWPTEPELPQFADFQKKSSRRGGNSTHRNDDNAPEIIRDHGSIAQSVSRRAAQRRAAAAAKRSQTTGRSQIEESDHNPDIDNDQNDDDPLSYEDEDEEEEEEEPVRNRVTQFSDLTTVGQANWKIAFELYKANLSVYNAKTNARSAFSNWVFKSIGPNYQHITKGRDLPEIYQAIKDQWLPFRKNIAKDDRRLSEWITRWQKLVNDGVEHKIPQIATPSSWFEDLVDALKNTTNGKIWVLGELATLEDDILE
ncbi:hypothetical protein B0T26DRAFT_610777, partial [Lasiosphaeria miniovina]